MKLKINILLFLVYSNLLVAQTDVPGSTIDGDTWTPENSPYYINGDLTIENLTIEAGVEVIFTDKYKFEVNRILKARGFYSDSIYFKPHTSNADGWEGINFKNTSTSTECLLSYCRIEGAVNQGISVDQKSPVIANCRIVHNTDNGIKLKDTNVEIKHCVVSYNTGHGIELDASHISASNSIISRNTVNGIHSRNNQDAITLMNVVVADNRNLGISSEKADLTVKNSIIFDNTDQIFIVEQIPDVTYSAVQGATVYPGAGNINTPPEFENRNIYTLSPKSFCVDAGDLNIIYNDKYFPPSLGNTHNDMGAYGGPEAYGWYPPLYIKPQSISFGKVTQDSSDFISAHVLNYRDLMIEVTEINFQGTNSHVFSSDKQNFNIPVLDSTTVLLSFIPDRESVFQSDWVLHTSSHGTVNVPVSGEGIVPKMDLLLKQLDFDRVMLGESASMYLPILNYGSDTLRLNMMLLTPSAFTLSKPNLLIGPGSLVDSVEVTFEPNLPTTFQDSLIILSNDPNKKRVAVSLTGVGIGPAINFDLESLDFGNVSVFSDSSLSLIIENSGNADLLIDGLNIIDQHLDSVVFEIIHTDQETPFTLEPDSSTIVKINFAPIKADLIKAQLIIKSTDPFNEEASVALRGRGIAGSLDLSPSELDFVEVRLNSQSILDLKIMNKGTDELTIDSLKIIDQHPDSMVFKIINSDQETRFTLEPDSSTIVQIGFTPVKAGLITAQLIIKSNDPFKEEVPVALSGTGIAGSLILSATELNFNKVPLDSQNVLNLLLSNMGMDQLTIDTVKIIDQHPDSMVFRIIYIDLETPFTLDPDSNIVLHISFTPIKAGMETAKLIIKSDDPFREEAEVHLNGTGTSAQIILSTTELNFGNVALESDSLKTIYIHNMGLAELFIPYDSISITGTHANAYVIEGVNEDIIVVPDDSAELRITFEPIQIGFNQAELKIHNNDPVDSVVTVTLSGMGFDASPVSITFDELLSTDPFTNGRSAIIGFNITGSSSVDSCFVYVRHGGKPTFTKLLLYQQSSESWSAQIDASLVTERGVEYYVMVHHGPLLTYFPATGGGLPNAIQVAVPQMQFPWQTKEDIYQMISIPLATSGQDLKTLFEDELGPYDNTKYRIYDLPDGIQYQEVAEMDKTLPPGKAMWLITEDTTDLSISNAQSVNTSQDFQLQLQQGWNLIATPFAFSVAWDQISTDLALRYYNGEDWPFATLLEPFKGYAVNAPNDTILLIPAKEALPVMKPASTKQNQNFADWRIQISAESATARDQFNYAGAFNMATSNIDNHDYPEPLPIGDFISLYLVPDNTSEKYSTDYREPGAGQYVFEFEVSCNIDEQIKIIFQEENLPENYDWIVVSEEKDIYFPQRIIEMSDTLSRYKMFIGTEQYIADTKSSFKQLPLSYHLEQNYPNPFNPNTTIEYSLPEASSVTITIYNILGQRINSLLRGVKMEAGYHQMEWDGKNESGTQVSSGIYFLQLQTEVYNHYIKMILNR